MIRRCELERALALVHKSDVHTDIEAALRPDRAGGRPRQLPVDLFLAAVILTVSSGRRLSLVGVHKLLTSELARSTQVHYGVRWRDKDGRPRVLQLRQVRYMLAAIDRKYRYTDAALTAAGVELDEFERQERAESLQRIVDRLVEATIPAHLPATERLALDSTALESWARNRRRGTKTAKPDGVSDADFEQLEKIMDTLDDLPDDVAFDVDANLGYRTRTYDNHSNWCSGYDIFGLTAMREPGDAVLNRPLLTARLVVRPAGGDVVAPAMGMFHRLIAEGRTIAELAADRAWSYKVPENWATPVRKLGITVHLDLHPNDQGVTDHDGMRMLAGVPHCPNMPDRLIDIRRPRHLSVGPETPKMSARRKALRAQRVQELATFKAAIAERQQYAFQRHTSIDVEGNGERWKCPAQAGKVICASCPLAQLVAGNEDRPTIENPPALDVAPTCCKQETITLPAAVNAKLRQPLYWGSDEWIEAFNRRTYIESVFGNWKSTKTENVKRGWTYVVGLVKTTLMVALMTVAANLRSLRRWAERVGDYTDPLTLPDPPDHGFEELESSDISINGPPAHAAA
ncbi:MAG: hypothetical protein NVS3B18_14390 [Candidatus Dormibacteria bacterium]